MLISWVGILLTGHEFEVFSHAIQHMQQEWSQVQAYQAVHDIATSIGIAGIPDSVPSASHQLVEAAYDPLALSSTGSDR